MSFISPFSKPKTLGEGIQRIVNKAGKSSKASIVSQTPNERIYSNGVHIVSRDNLNNVPNSDTVMESALYVFKPNAKKDAIAFSDIYAVKGRYTVYADNNKTCVYAKCKEKEVGDAQSTWELRRGDDYPAVFPPSWNMFLDCKIKEKFAKSF